MVQSFALYLKRILKLKQNPGKSACFHIAALTFQHSVLKKN